MVTVVSGIVACCDVVGDDVVVCCVVVIGKVVVNCDVVVICDVVVNRDVVGEVVVLEVVRWDVDVITCVFFVVLGTRPGYFFVYL